MKQLCAASKPLYDIILPELYATIIIRVDDEMRLQRVDVKPFLRGSINPAGHLHYVKNVRVQSRFHSNLEERCVHYRDMEEGDASRGIRSRRLATDMMSLLKHLGDQRLQSFRLAISLVILSR